VSQPGQMWGGRFHGDLDERFASFQKSLPHDHVLALADLRVNRAWSAALARAGVFTGDELAQVHAAIDALEREWRERGAPADDPAEDVHSLV
jgi:argininosuccinate lyase